MGALVMIHQAPIRCSETYLVSVYNVEPMRRLQCAKEVNVHSTYLSCCSIEVQMSECQGGQPFISDMYFSPIPHVYFRPVAHV